METRLLQQLFTIANADKENLLQHLREFGAPINDEIICCTRGLHEQILRSPRPLRTTTFHAFCQEILRRFPLEADVPPGFELIEGHDEIADEAWQSLLSDVTRAPESQFAHQLDALLSYCGEMSNLGGSKGRDPLQEFFYTSTELKIGKFVTLLACHPGYKMSAHQHN